MNNEYILMLEDDPVLYINFDDIEVKIINQSLMPFSLRNKIQEANVSNIKEYYKINSKNLSLVEDYAASRVLSLSRENAKKIYAAFSFSQDNSTKNRAEICFFCKGVSLTDAYWFTTPDSQEQWKDVDLRHKHLSEIIDVALLGDSPTITTNYACPELTTKGLFQKCWIRENDTTYLLKSDKTTNFINTRAEILTSKILDCTNVPHVHYEQSSYKGLTVAKCANFVPEHMSFVDAHEIMEYCKTINKEFSTFVLKNVGKDFANIAVIDYILQNTDRHDQNYGFLMDNNTGNIICMAPLFDHNLALIADFQQKDVRDTLSQMLNQKMTIQQMYEKFVPYADIQFDCHQWQELKKEEKEYEDVFSKIEQRIADIPCIHKTLIPNKKLDFSDMLKDLEQQRQSVKTKEQIQESRER